jgi:hypothetical protein
LHALAMADALTKRQRLGAEVEPRCYWLEAASALGPPPCTRRIRPSSGNPQTAH